MSERTIQVDGCASVRAEPDRCVLSFDLKAQRREYGEALDELARQTAQLRAALESADVARASARTADFGVTTEHDHRAEHRRFLGFVARHSLRVELPFERERLQRAFRAIAASGVSVEFELRFEHSRREALAEQAMEAAVRQARARAELLARAAGVSLGPLRRMQHGIGEGAIEQHRFSLSSGLAEADFAVPELEPAAVEVSERVTLIWEIG